MGNHFVILGAGPAGLSAAYKLVEAGKKVTVLELEDQVGGLCRSIRKDGFFFDLGGHRFITKDDEIQIFLEELMGDQFLIRPRKSVIRLKNKFFNYPLDIKNVVKNLPITFTFHAFIDFLLTSLLQKLYPRRDSSFENWVVNRFGVTLYDLYFAPYSEKLWGVPPNSISADWAAQRISLINLWDVFIRMFGKTRDEPKTYAKKFYYPRLGCGQVFEMMAEKITKRGNKVIFKAAVKNILMENNRIKKVTYTHSGIEKKISGDYFISTIPLPEFIKKIRPHVDDHYTVIADKMDYRSIKFLNLMINKKQITDNTWIYIPENEFLFFRIQEWRNWSPTVVPVGKTGVTLEIACYEEDDIWNSPDEVVYNRCMDDIEKIGLFNRNDVMDYFVLNVKHCYPIYTLDYSEKVESLIKYIANFENAISIGRQGLYRYNNMDHSIKMGLMTAEHILNELPKIDIFNIASEKIIFDWQDPGK